MAEKIGVAVQNRITLSGKVSAAARTHKSRLCEALAARSAAEQGESAISFETYAAVVEGLAVSLDSASNALHAAEEALSAESADDVPVRTARDAAQAALYATATRLRTAVEENLPADALRTYGLGGETPKSPRPLLLHAGNVANLLENKPASVTSDIGTTFSTEAAVVTLRAKAADLKTALDDIDREARELEDALSLRDRALASWSTGYQGVATALTGLLILGGMPELAARVRPTSRTVSGEDAGDAIDTLEEPVEE